MIQNVEYTVPSQVKNLFYGNLAPFSDYIIFTESRYNTSTVYVMYERQPWEKAYTKHTVTYNGNHYTYAKEDSTINDISVSSPYYAYASEGDNGIVETLPSVQGVSMLCLVVLCGCVLLKTLFGGIKLWQARKTVF